MLILTPSNSLRIVTSHAGAVDVAVGWADTVNGTLGDQGTDAASITTAATTTVCTCPATTYGKLGSVETIRSVTSIVVNNAHASVDQTISIIAYFGAVSYTLAKFSLLAGESQRYDLAQGCVRLESGDTMQVILGDALTTHVYLAYEDRFYGSQNLNTRSATCQSIATAATHVVMTVPAQVYTEAGSYRTLRTVGGIIIHNAHATDPQTFALTATVQGVTVELLTATLSAGESYRYETGGDVLGSAIPTAPSIPGGTNLSYTTATRVLASDTGTDATLPLVSSGDAGLAPASGGGTSNYLRADGTWTAPAGTTNLTYTAATRVLASDTGTDATLPLVTSGDAGLAPASGGGTTNFLRADATWATPAGGSSPNWHGVLYGAYGGCNPQDLLLAATTHGTVAATPTNIGTTVARICYFRPPANITVDKIRFFGVGVVAAIYQCAIYNGDTLARVSAQLSITTASAAWGSTGSDLNLSLTANQLYFIAVSANTTGTTAGLLCIAPTVAATTGLLGVLPKSWPGSLDIDSGYMSGGFAQFAVTAGALPDPAATIAVQAAWTGGFPMFFLDSSNA
jgi:hypothetical protein